MRRRWGWPISDMPPLVIQTEGITGYGWDENGRLHIYVDVLPDLVETGATEETIHG